MFFCFSVFPDNLPIFFLGHLWFGIPFFWQRQLRDVIAKHFLWILFSFITEGLPSFCIRIVFFFHLGCFFLMMGFYDLIHLHSSCINRFLILFPVGAAHKNSNQ